MCAVALIIIIIIKSNENGKETNKTIIINMKCAQCTVHISDCHIYTTIKSKCIKLNEKSILGKYESHVSSSRPPTNSILYRSLLCTLSSSFCVLFNCCFSPFLSHKNVQHVISYEIASTTYLFTNSNSHVYIKSTLSI